MYYFSWVSSPLMNLYKYIFQFLQLFCLGFIISACILSGSNRFYSFSYSHWQDSFSCFLISASSKVSIRLRYAFAIFFIIIIATPLLFLFCSCCVISRVIDMVFSNNYFPDFGHETSRHSKISMCRRFISWMIFLLHSSQVFLFHLGTFLCISLVLTLPEYPCFFILYVSERMLHLEIWLLKRFI